MRLVGTRSNRAAIGAKIEVKVQDSAGAVRSIWRTVGETSSFGGNPLELHIGLGAEAHIQSLDIWWPATDSRQHFANVAVNQFIEIKEFADAYTKLDRKPMRMGDTAAAASVKR